MASEDLEQIIAGLCARQITVFPVECASTSTEIARINDRMRDQDYSHMPLRDSNGEVVSVLHRDADAPIPLDRERHTIKAEAPLAVAIKRLPEAGFLLVESGESGQPDGIAGIINHADVLSLPVRLLIYTRTMEIEKHIQTKIKGSQWRTIPQLETIWKRVKKVSDKEGDQRSRPENYLSFSELMKIGKFWEPARLAKDEEMSLPCDARNFACHASIEMATDEIPAKVEQYVSLVERLFADMKRL